MKTASYKKLYAHEDRSIAHMAAIARANTIWGGATALVYARRLDRMGSKLNLGDVASSVYSASSGKWHEDYEAWECPECGCAHLGQEKAFNCCKLEIDDGE